MVVERHRNEPASTLGTCICGHEADRHGALFGCWHTPIDGSLDCDCRMYREQAPEPPEPLEGLMEREPALDYCAGCDRALTPDDGTFYCIDCLESVGPL